jgi:hypothetical protein
MSLVVIKEAVAVGLIAMIIGMLIHVVFNYFMPHDMNNKITLAVHFLIVGIVFHILCEVTGINKWYCKNGNVSVSIN